MPTSPWRPPVSDITNTNIPTTYYWSLRHSVDRVKCYGAVGGETVQVVDASLSVAAWLCAVYSVFVDRTAQQTWAY